MSTPIALTIAGSDPSGGAGIQADLKTFTVLGVYGAAVITALTAQSTQGVEGIFPVPADFVSRQIATLVEDMRPAAIKTGMLNDANTVRAVAAAVRRYDLHPLVVDPVMVATSGDSLMSEDMVAALREELLPLADLLTPNRHEAARLVKSCPARRSHEMLLQGRELMALGCKAVVITGGDTYGPLALDMLVDGDGSDGLMHLELPRIKTKNTHGTGCAFSAAVAAGLARGESLRVAVQDAKRFVHEALQAGQSLGIGEGSGPVDHLYASRPRTRH